MAPSRVQLVRANTSSLEVSWGPSKTADTYLLQLQRYDIPTTPAAAAPASHAVPAPASHAVPPPGSPSAAGRFTWTGGRVGVTLPHLLCFCSGPEDGDGARCSRVAACPARSDGKDGPRLIGRRKRSRFHGNPPVCPQPISSSPQMSGMAALAAAAAAVTQKIPPSSAAVLGAVKTVSCRGDVTIGGS